jgi:hypothetical protein
MFLKILAPLVVLIIALIQSIYSDQINNKKWLKTTLVGLLLFSFIIGLFILNIDDNDSKKLSQKQKNNIDSLRIENSFLSIKLDSLHSTIEQGIQNRSKQEIEMLKKVNELNNKLEPFVNIALRKYPTIDKNSALNKLAQDVAITKKLAEPPSLILSGKEINKDKNSTSIILQFKPSKNETLGLIEFHAEIEKNSSSKILDFWPDTKGGAFSSGKDSKKISSNGKTARLIYSLIGAGNPAFELKVSKSTVVKISGNYLLKPITLKIE